MFEGQNNAESQGRIPAGAGEPDRRVLDSFGGGTQTDVVNRRDIVEDTNTPKANPVTSIIRNSRPDRGGYPDVDGAVPPNHAPPPRDVLATPLSFDQLNDALGSARDEMRTLCRQYDELQRLVAVRLGKGKELKGSEQMLQLHLIYEYPPPLYRMERKLDLRMVRSKLVMMASLQKSPDSPRKRQDEHRQQVIASMTNVRPSALLSGDPGSAPFKSSPSTHGNLSAQDISRALDFVERVDEIIWRRSSLPTNSSLDPIFSAGNVEGLLSRLDLWEKMVRSTSA
ncbi:hypothetical protein BKA83DRAFT_4498642 [Pisolithus microcarpus]|nr:hypothetical protein BKA83DRAFT_4498642 [Pisolithus microcarpus]